MKTSYTKRALAFWLAVAMLATGAPAALAREPDTGTGGSTSVSGTTTTPTTPGGQDDAGAGQGGGEVTTPPEQSVELDHITLSESSVTVTGGTSAAQTVMAKAYSSTDNTTAINNSKLTWSISGSGVSIDNEGKITVDAKAKAGNYTVTATAKTDTNTTETQTADATVTGTATATLTVARHGEHVATSVTVSDGAASLEIPSDDTVVGTNFTATAQDAFDNDLSSTVTWTVTTKQPELVKIDSKGKLTVKKGATPETVKVVANCGQVKSAEKEVTIQYADSELQSITEVWMSGDNTDVNVTDGLTLEAGKSATLFVKGKDQYGNEISVNSGVTVSVGQNSSLTYKDATVTADANAVAGTETITVACGGKSTEIQVAIRAKTTEQTTLAFVTKPKDTNVYGDPITGPTITVNGKAPEDGTVRYEYREIADKPVNALSNDTLTTMPRDVGKYQVTAYYDSNDQHASVSTTFEITKKPVTVTVDNKTITKGDSIPTLTFTVPSGALAYNDTKDALGVTLTTNATSTSAVGSYNITGTSNSKNYDVTVTSGKLTIEAESGIRMSAGKASEDSNRSNYDLSVRRGDGYIDLNADADDDLVRQTVDDTRAYWIGFDLSVYLDGAGKSVDDLYVSSSGRSNSWARIGSLRNPERYIGDFYLDNLGSDNDFTLWFDTDGDSDNSDRLYFATSSSGANEYYIDVDFDSYSGSSSSSSGSSSSDTSKKDGDRVSTTTIDKTPSVKSRSATVTFSSSAMSDALDENKREARHEDADVTYIELDARTSKTVDDTTITVPRKSLDNIADEDTGLILTTNHGTFTFDDRALAKIYDTCDKTNIDFYIEEEDDDQYIVLIKDGSDDVIDLGSGEVEIVFDYRLKSGEKSSDVNVYRIGDGDKEFDYARDMKADYSSSKKEATFTTDTLGTFLVTTDTLKTGSDSTTTTPPTTPSYSRFVDVPSSRWSATYINKLASLGIINGTGGGYFEPTLQVTREEFVKMLAGVAGANVTGYTSSRFPDVPMSRWSASYIAWAADRGITTGTDGGRFAPTMKITREEMATMIYRYVQISGKTLPAKNAPVTFADADQISSWAQTAVSVMQQAGIIDGNVTNGRYTFDPKVPASREECAKMLSILYDLL